MKPLTAEALDTIRTPNAYCYAGAVFLSWINYRGARRNPARKQEHRRVTRENIALLRCALKNGY